MASSTAIDFDRFTSSGSKEAIRVVPEGKTHPHNETKRPPYFKYGALAACLFAIVMLLIGSYMQLTEATSQSDRLKTQIEQLKGEQNALEAKKEQLYNLSAVEAAATSRLGMVKLDKSNIIRVDLSNGSKATILSNTRQQSSVISGLVKSFNAVVEYLN